MHIKHVLLNSVADKEVKAKKSYEACEDYISNY